MKVCAEAQDVVKSEVLKRMAKQNTYDADSIAVLEGLEAVRKRPGMYIGSVSTKGLNHLVYEIVDNAVDEHLAGFCNLIEVYLEKDGSATALHAGGKFDDSSYKTSGGLHGVGSSVVNALSTYMDVKISRDGGIHHDRYERGIPVVKLEGGLLPIIGKTKKTGTEVNFLPDDTIFEKTKFKAEEIKAVRAAACARLILCAENAWKGGLMSRYYSCPS